MKKMTRQKLGGIENGVPACPGLVKGEGRLTFRDATGNVTALLSAERISLKQVGPAMGKSYSYARQEIKQKRLYPVLVRNGRVVEVFACAVVDWKARQVLGRQVAA